MAVADGRVVVEVLGPIRAHAAGHELDLGGPRQQALLAALALHAGSTVSVDALADAVWDGDPPAAVQRTFRTYVSRLRKSFAVHGVEPADVVVTDPTGYRLAAEAVELDADRFVELVEEGRARLGAGEAVAAGETVDAALALWSGRAYGAVGDTVWARPEVTRLEGLRTAARELRVQALLDAGRVDEAVAEADLLAGEQPERESAVRLRVVGRYRAGRHAEALAVARDFRDRLAEETGLDPSPQFLELERMVLDRDPRLDRPVAGRRLRGYVLHEVLATTPLGSVHRAEQPSIGREVAVTVVPAARADAPDVVRLFEARAQEVAGVEHAHVVPLYDYWREPGGAYLVTRLPAGGTLSQRLTRGPLPAGDALRIARQTTAAVAAAHANGLVHGALTTDAVVLDADGDAHLWGFALEPPSGGASGDLVDLAAVLEQVIGRVPEGGRGDGALARVRAAAGAAADAADDAVTTVGGLVALLDEAAGDAAATTPAVVRLDPGPNPYRGLAAFRETDDTVFFGRQRLARTIAARLQRQPFVAVVGPSGAGKSSVVHAAVVPALRRDGAYVTSMVPGAAPVDELAVALSRVAAVELPDLADELVHTEGGLTSVLQRVLPTPDAEAVLVVDQFEELFTLAAAEERDAFLGVLRDALDHPLRRARVVVTVRADLLGQVLEHLVAGRLVADRVVLVEPMGSADLHEVVVGPAEVAGAAVEPALATAVVADAIRSPGSLPLVQFALTEVYEAADDGTMTLDAYRRLGGIEGVLGQRAEELWSDLDETGRTAARALFDRLVLVSGDGPPTRRRAHASELAEVPAGVVEAFASARLLRLDHDEASREPTVEVAHEALFREWPRLVAWIEEGRDDLRLLGHLIVAAGEWDGGGREDAELYRGTRLASAAGLVARRPDAVAPLERDFVAAGVARREAAAAAERLGVTRLRRLTGGLAVGLVGALVAGGLAWSARQGEVAARLEAVAAQEDEAAAAAREAEARAAQERVATAAQGDALAAAALAALDGDTRLAGLLALESHAVDPDAGSVGAMLQVLRHDPRIVSYAAGPDLPGAQCGVSPTTGDRTVVSAAPSDAPAYAVVSDFSGGTYDLVTLPGHWRCPVVDPAGRWLLAGDEEASLLRVLDVASGDVVAEAPGWAQTPGLAEVLVAPTSEEVAYVTDAGVVRRSLPDLDLVESVDDERGFWAVAYDETGTALVASTRDDRLLVAEPGGEPRASDVAPGEIALVAASRAADLVVGGGQLGMWATSLTEPGELTPVELRGVSTMQPTVSPDGRVLVVPTSAGLEVLDTSDLTLLGEPIGIDVTFGSLSWRPDGTLGWVGPAGKLTLDLDRRTGIGELVGDVTPEQYYLDPAPDGSGGTQANAEGFVRVGADGAVLADVSPFGNLHPVAVTADGGWVHLDLEERVFERAVGGEVVLSVPFPDELTGPVNSRWSAPRVDHGVVTAVLLPTGPVGTAWVLGVDIDSGETAVLHSYDMADAGAVPEQAHALPGGRVLVGHRGSWVDVRSFDGEVVVPRHDLPITGASVLGVSLDGERVAIGRDDGAIEVRDDELEEVVLLAGAATPARSIHFAADGQVVSRHEDGATLLWDVASGRLVGPLVETASWVPHGIALSTAGDAVVHATPAGVVRIPLDTERWRQQLCATTGGVLRQEDLDAVTDGLAPLDPCGQRAHLAELQATVDAALADLAP